MATAEDITAEEIYGDGGHSLVLLRYRHSFDDSEPDSQTSRQGRTRYAVEIRTADNEHIQFEKTHATRGPAIRFAEAVWHGFAAGQRTLTTVNDIQNMDGNPSPNQFLKDQLSFPTCNEDPDRGIPRESIEGVEVPVYEQTHTPPLDRSSRQGTDSQPAKHYAVEERNDLKKVKMIFDLPPAWHEMDYFPTLTTQNPQTGRYDTLPEKMAGHKFVEVEIPLPKFGGAEIDYQVSIPEPKSVKKNLSKAPPRRIDPT